MLRLSIRALPGLLVVLALALALAASAPAKSKPITGKLSKRGYTVIALDDQGVATSVVAKPKFKLRPRANKVTLQLRAPNGSYAGPIVVQGDGGGKAKKSKKRKKKSKRAIVGVKAGASLGKIKVKAGFAVAKGVAKKSLDTKRTATAKKGVPIGAGNFGRVAVATLKGPSADRDLDGIPAPVDIDDDGDLILDDVDRNSAGGARAAQTTPGVPGSSFTQLQLHGNEGIAGGFPVGTQPVNANVPGLSADEIDAQIESALRREGELSAGAGPFFASSELDCGALSYCSPGGTGRLITSFASFDEPSSQPFPACCDPDGDGFGSVPIASPRGGIGGNVDLIPGASSDQIRAGDTLIFKGTCSNFASPVCPPGTSAEATATLRSVFATVPALASYTDEAGVTHPVSYPIAPGTSFFVSDGSDAGSDVSVKLTVWRPQRRAIPEELPGGTGKWIDMGGLFHWAHAPGSAHEGCPQSSYSEPASHTPPTQPPSTLEPSTTPQGHGEPAFFFTDTARDDLANPGSTFSYTLNLTECFAGRIGPGGTYALSFVGALPANPTVFAYAGYLFRDQP